MSPHSTILHPHLIWSNRQRIYYSVAQRTVNWPPMERCGRQAKPGRPQPLTQTYHLVCLLWAASYPSSFTYLMTLLSEPLFFLFFFKYNPAHFPDQLLELPSFWSNIFRKYCFTNLLLKPSETISLYPSCGPDSSKIRCIWTFCFSGVTEHLCSAKSQNSFHGCT